MIRVLVTGANGQLGKCLQKIANLYPILEIIFMDSKVLDITNKDGVNQVFRTSNFDYCINCAAYTNVEQAEKTPDVAYAVNAEGVRNLVIVCKENNVKLIHISTDYIFPGKLHRPIREDDTPDPLSIYGSTKLEGEKILHDHPRALIFRTSWLYSIFGRNFVKSMINRMDKKEELSVVYDQVGSPTYAEDLAKAIMKIISDVESGEKPFVPGIFNFSNEGVCSWYDLAIEVCRQISCGGSIQPVETSAYPLPAKRPPYSVLNKSKIKEVYGVEVPYWRDSLVRCIKDLV